MVAEHRPQGIGRSAESAVLSAPLIPLIPLIPLRPLRDDRDMDSAHRSDLSGPSDLPAVDAALAARFVAVALANVAAEYPFHLVHYARDARDIAPPRALHPVFFGSYDWHSCVHMHWTLARCLRRHPQAPFAAAVVAHFDARLTPSSVAAECAYFGAPGRAGFERPYGWGWLLKLQAELIALAPQTPAAARGRDALAPLVALIVERLLAYLPRADHPVRAGTHGNSAFALALALDYAQAVQHRALTRAIEARAQQWFGADRRYPAAYEPSGDDFLSGGLTEARLMQRALDGCDFADWWAAFEPPADGLARWLAPVTVSDATDAKIVHLHGLNLSRAACWRALQPALPAPLQPAVARAVDAHVAASLPAATAGDYVGTHWLASFALLALDPG